MRARTSRPLGGCLLLFAWALSTWGQPCHSCQDGSLYPWVYDVDPVRNEVWAGVDHPYHQPWIPFEAPETPERRLERKLREGVRARQRGDLRRAERILQQVDREASQAWGPGCRLALAAREQIQGIRTEVGPAPEGTPASLTRTLATVRARLAEGRGNPDPKRAEPPGVPAREP